MAEIKWTDGQKAAIEASGRGTIVSAAAGSGKTAVLIEKLTRLLTDKEKNIRAENLLAVTFTNDAAAQMRDKLKISIDKKLRENPEDKWLQRQKDNLQLATIATINSFCLNFVKNNLDKFEFQGGLKILDESVSKMIYKQSYVQAIEEYCHDYPDRFKKLANAFEINSIISFSQNVKSSNSKKTEIKDIISDTYRFLRILPFRQQWIDESQKIYKDKAFAKQCYNAQIEFISEQAKKIHKDYDMICEILKHKISPDGPKERKREKTNILDDRLSKILDEITRFDTLLKNEEFDAIIYFVPDIKKPQFFTKGDLKKYYDCDDAVLNDFFTEINFIAQDMIKCFSDIREAGYLTEKRINENLAEVSEIFGYLCEVVEKIEAISYETKLERNAVEFSDVELMAKDLLVQYTDGEIKRTELCEELRKSGIYSVMNIDEFQDVNNLQDIIFKAISDSDDVNLLGRNLFVVGDVKQAIYRFRNTNPKLFVNSMANAEKYPDEMEAVYLQDNFRSRKEIINFTNYIFKKIMSAEVGEVNYNNKEMLRFGASYYPENEMKSPAIEVMLLEQHKNKMEGLLDLREEDDDYPYEEKIAKLAFNEDHMMIARKIKQMLSDKSYQVFDGKKMRQCRPSDFCILIRNHLVEKPLANALEFYGLSTYSQVETGYLKAREIALMLDFLRVVDNPMNDIALAAVLMSPIFCFTADDMAHIQKFRKKGDSKFLNHIYQVLSGTDSEKKNSDEKKSGYIDLGDDRLQNKCENVFIHIEKIRFSSMSMNIESLIRKIYDATDIMGLTSIYLDSDKKRANLRLLIDYANSYEMSSQEGISGFLRYVSSVYTDDNSFKQAISVKSDGDCVNIKTYHASKGLEFPYVFLYELDNSNDKDKKKKVFFNETDGFAFETSDNEHLINKCNPYFRHMAEISSCASKSEIMRLMYVGCTRAKEKLIVVVPSKIGNCNIATVKTGFADVINNVSVEDGIIPPDIVKNYSSMLEWLMLCFGCYKDNEVLLKWLAEDNEKINLSYSKIGEAKSKFEFADTDILFKVYSLSLDDIRDEAKECKKASKADSELTSRLINRFGNSKLKTKSVIQPSKLSVTEIVRNEMEKENKSKNINPEFFPSLPKFARKSGNFTAAERGTFTHKFMELADYSNAEKSVEAEIERLCSKGFFTENETKGIYVNKLKKFFASDFYKRIKVSTELYREKKFLVAMKDINIDEKYRDVTGSDGMIQGIADCVFRENDGFVIVDYKTDNFNSADDMKKYGTQLSFYKAALELVLDAKITSCYIYSFKLEMGEEFVF